MGKITNNQLPNNLPQLQNYIKKDPDSYKKKFYDANFAKKFQLFNCINSIALSRTKPKQSVWITV